MGGRLIGVLLYSGISGFIQAEFVLFWQKLLFFGKVFVFGQKWLCLGKVVVFWQKWLFSGKLVVFGQLWL